MTAESPVNKRPKMVMVFDLDDGKTSLRHTPLTVIYVVFQFMMLTSPQTHTVIEWKNPVPNPLRCRT